MALRFINASSDQATCRLRFFAVHNSTCGKVMLCFYACLLFILFRGACGVAGGHAWQGRGHVWQGACVVCVVGDMRGRGGVCRMHSFFF